mgnify:CR=1 FL=1
MYKGSYSHRDLTAATRVRTQLPIPCNSLPLRLGAERRSWPASFAPQALPQSSAALHPRTVTPTPERAGSNVSSTLQPISRCRTHSCLRNRFRPLSDSSCCSAWLPENDARRDTVLISSLFELRGRWVRQLVGVFSNTAPYFRCARKVWRCTARPLVSARLARATHPSLALQLGVQRQESGSRGCRMACSFP